MDLRLDVVHGLEAHDFTDLWHEKLAAHLAGTREWAFKEIFAWLDATSDAAVPAPTSLRSSRRVPSAPFEPYEPRPDTSSGPAYTPPSPPQLALTAPEPGCPQPPNEPDALSSSSVAEGNATASAAEPDVEPTEPLAEQLRGSTLLLTLPHDASAPAESGAARQVQVRNP